MGANVNGTFDIIQLIEKTWSSIWGVLVVWLAEILTIVFFHKQLYQLPKVGIIILIVVLLPLTFLVWTISTRRWFQRTGYWFLLHLVGILAIGGLLYHFFYPYIIKGTSCDLTNIQYWGVGTIMLFLLWLSYRYIHKKHKKLTIVFLVSNKSKYEDDIIQALREARDRVLQVTPDIDIIIPPFGIANTTEGCEHYINGHFNQADAAIFASLIDSPTGSEFGYAFTHFTSRMSRRYVKQKQGAEESVEMLMGDSYRCHEWNTLNINKDQISRQLTVAENLTHLFLMYVSCIYLQKNKFTEAIETAESLYTFTSTGNLKYDASVKDLIAYSYVTAEQIEEQENRDYDQAHKILNQCVAKLPHVRFSIYYDLAMARLYFYEGRIKESRKYTKKVSDSYKNAEWYVAVNLAFYAIYEQKPAEVVTHYKKMLKMHKPYKDEVVFSIKFQLIELDKTTNLSYKMFLLHGLSFLYLYIDQSKSDGYLREAEKCVAIAGYSNLEQMRNLIKLSKGKLKTRKWKDKC